MSAIRDAQAALSRAKREAAAADQAVAAAEKTVAAAQQRLATARERAQTARWTALRAEHDLDAVRREPSKRDRMAPPSRAKRARSGTSAAPIPFPREERAAHAEPGAARPDASAAREEPARTERREHAAAHLRAQAGTHRAAAPSPRARAAALAALTDLLPDRITARFGKKSREVRLEAGARYRVDPLNAAKRKDRGRVGSLLTWDVSGTSGVIEWVDAGGRDRVALADLVRD